MAKGFILMDIPGNCVECPLCYKSEMVYLGNFIYEQEYKCKKCPEEVKNKSLNAFLLCCKPYWCPIKEVPEKQIRDYPEYDNYITGYDDGWDDCLDEILGEKDE